MGAQRDAPMRGLGHRFQQLEMPIEGFRRKTINRVQMSTDVSIRSEKLSVGFIGVNGVRKVRIAPCSRLLPADSMQTQDESGQFGGHSRGRLVYNAISPRVGLTR